MKPARPLSAQGWRRPLAALFALLFVLMPLTIQGTARSAVAATTPGTAGTGTLASPSPTATTTNGSSQFVGLHVQGNQILNSTGQPIILRGVNHAGTEYACAQSGSSTTGYGWGLFDHDLSSSEAQAITTWHANIVRIPLNEDCWLGINNINPAYGGTNYQNYISGLVSRLRAAGLYVILDLHWSAPSTIVPLTQQPLPDADHSITFWQQVATTFKGDGGVIFDLFNEPFIYNSETQNPSQDDWACWLNGCGMSVAYSGGSTFKFAQNWQAAGMQQLITTIRATGATNLIMVGGLDWANDLSGWLSHKPSDPVNNLAVSWHNYAGETCANLTCWNSTVAPLAQQEPIITGETGETSANVCSGTTFTQSFLPWADQHGLSYLAWTYNVWGCNYGLIQDYTGTPTSVWGQFYKNYLTQVTAAGTPIPTNTPSVTPVPPTSAPTNSATPGGSLTGTPTPAPGTPSALFPAQTVTFTPGSVPSNNWLNPQITAQASVSNATAGSALTGGMWHSGVMPSSSAPVWLAFDVSHIASSHQNVVLYYDQQTPNEWYNITGNADYNGLAGTFTVDVNTAPGGGAAPTSGWTTVQTISNNTVSELPITLSLASVNWVRLNVTGLSSASQAGQVSAQVNFYDAMANMTNGVLDVGDSITLLSMGHANQNSFGNGTTLPPGPGGWLGQNMVTAGGNTLFPEALFDGVGGTTSADLCGSSARLTRDLAIFRGKFVILAEGMNDANGSAPSAYVSNVQCGVNAVLAAGKTPIVPLISYTSDPTYQPYVYTLNQRLQTYLAANPQVLPGPDFYDYFYARPYLLRNASATSTDVHPNADGMAAMVRVWSNWFCQYIYGCPTTTDPYPTGTSYVAPTASTPTTTPVTGLPTATATSTSPAPTATKTPAATGTAPASTAVPPSATATLAPTKTPAPTTTPIPGDSPTPPSATATLAPTKTPAPTTTPIPGDSPTPPSATAVPLAPTSAVRADTFARPNITTGWGTASDGNTWAPLSGATAPGGIIGISSNKGRLSQSSASLFTILGSSLTSADQEGLVRWSVDSTSATAGILLRAQNSNNYYLARYNGANAIEFYKKVGGVKGVMTALSFTPTVGTFYWLRFRAQGTTIAIKVWADGTAEPSTWNFTTTDTSLSSPGSVGLYGFASTSTPNTVDSFSVR